MCLAPGSEEGQGYRLHFPVRNQPLGASNDKVCQGAEAPTDANRSRMSNVPSSSSCLQLELQVLKKPLKSDPMLRFIWHLAGDWWDVTSQRHRAFSCDPGVIHVWWTQPLLTVFMLWGWRRELRCTTQRSHTSYEPLKRFGGISLAGFSILSPFLWTPPAFAPSQFQWWTRSNLALCCPLFPPMLCLFVYFWSADPVNLC